jgi:uncharacterized protein YcbK (DUF882 family)|tara:strand:+ start:559 stop:1248 length:690 start_codon:yes stop_codon:yes gene_type:complete
LKRRYFLSAISASAIFQAQISSAGNGGIKGTSLFFKSLKQPLIDIEASTGFFNHFEPDEMPEHLGTKVLRTPQVSLEENASLTMWNTNTDEHIIIRPMTSLGLDHGELKRANYFMRDWRLNEVKKIDPNIILGLLEIQQGARRNGFNTDIQFLSGYRSAETNKILRQKTNGVAPNSLHIQAKAIDFFLPKVPVKETIRLAKAVGIGGVGGYVNFVHIDSGRRRLWGTAT